MSALHEHLNVRPEIAEGIMPDPPCDRLGRRQPRRILGLMSLFRSIPTLASEFSVAVPDEFWAMDVSDDGYHLAVVSCPCTEAPRVEIARVVECSCGRFFFFTGDAVLVAGSPAAAQA